MPSATWWQGRHGLATVRFCGDGHGGDGLTEMLMGFVSVVLVCGTRTFTWLSVQLRACFMQLSVQLHVLNSRNGRPIGRWRRPSYWLGQPWRPRTEYYQLVLYHCGIVSRRSSNERFCSLKSRKTGTGNFVMVPPSGNRIEGVAKRFAFLYGKGWSRTLSTTLQIAAVPPIPKASARMATTEKPGLFRSILRP
jgi:hypothetical protein